MTKCYFIYQWNIPHHNQVPDIPQKVTGTDRKVQKACYTKQKFGLVLFTNDNMMHNKHLDKEQPRCHWEHFV